MGHGDEPAGCVEVRVNRSTANSLLRRRVSYTRTWRAYEEAGVAAFDSIYHAKRRVAGTYHVFPTHDETKSVPIRA